MKARYKRGVAIALHAIERLDLYEYPDESLEDLEPVVVGQFRLHSNGVREEVRRILRLGRTRLQASTEAEGLIEEIRMRDRNLEKVGV